MKIANSKPTDFDLAILQSIKSNPGITAKRDNICKANNITLIRLPNSYAKDYTFILNIIKKYERQAIDESEEMQLI